MAEPRPERKIIIIPAKKESPQEQAKKRNLRVAAYCRVSTGDEEHLTSYENQKAFYTEKIMKNPDWTMVDIFADEGITGTSTCRRKQFLRMIRQCRQGKIDMILAKSVSRFARNTLDTISYTRELRSLGIAVIFEEQNINSIYPESEFLIALHAAFAQSESESISANVRWGKRQSIKDGKVTFQYKTMLGYEKGPDGGPVVIPEEAKIICRIFEWYLAGRSVQNIRQALEASGVRNAAGTTEWTTSNLRAILTNEKYCGDALLQKTFIKDCISKKAILNTGQLPKVLIQDNHEAIVSREMFDAVQLEIARRRAQDGRTRKSAPTGRVKFSGKYALSGLLFCAECGTAYRRVVWTQHGEKRAVWRCTSRLDYGKRYCLHSPTLDEGPLQQAVLNAINSAMSDHGTLTAQLIDTMEQELAPIPGESMSLGDIDRAMEGLGQQFNDLLRKAADANNADSYTAQFQSISTAMAEFKRRKAMILQIRQEQEQTNRRVQAVASVLKTASSELTEWDDNVIYQLLEKVTVLSREHIRVTLRDGLEIEQAVEQPKRRKFAFLKTDESTIKHLISQICVIDGASDIIDVEKNFRKQIRYSCIPKYENQICERLEGWWYKKAIEALCSDTPIFVTQSQVRSFIVSVSQEYAECPYQPGKLTAFAAVKFTVKGADNDMAVFRVEKNKGYTVMSNRHLRNKALDRKSVGRERVC